MLNVFPSLLDFSLLAPVILRIVAGLIFVDLGYLKLRKEKARWATLYNSFLFQGNLLLLIIATIEIVGGIMLIIGLYTQIAALLLSILTFMNVSVEFREPSFIRRDFVFYLMLLVITLSLLVTGAGLFAFDLPL